MIKKYWLIIVVVSLIGCSTTDSKVNNYSFMAANYNSPSYVKYKSSVIFDGINDYWQFFKKENISGVESTVYVPYTETDGVWSEKIQISYEHVSSKITAHKYCEQIIFSEVNDQCYYAPPNFRIIRETDNDLTFSYAMKNCGKNADQTVVGRVMRAPNSVSIITYAVKHNTVIPPPVDQMIKLVNDAKVVRD
jgi:hypothetical protein